MMGKMLIDPPLVAPITLEEAKISERIDLNDAENDAHIERLIRSATQVAEEYTNRAFITQRWKVRTTYFSRVVKVPSPPLQFIDPDSVVIGDESGVTPLDPGSYGVDEIAEPGQIILKSSANVQYPSSSLSCNSSSGGGSETFRPYRYLEYEFVGGYGDNPEDVPEQIREAILQIFGHMYENRESQMIPPFAEFLLAPFKVWYL